MTYLNEGRVDGLQGKKERTEEWSSKFNREMFFEYTSFDYKEERSLPDCDRCGLELKSEKFVASCE